MKIAFVYDSVYPWVKGGVEKRLYEIGTRLVDRGHEVHWYCVGWWFDEHDVGTREHDGIVLHGVCAPTELYVDGRRSVSEALRFAGSLVTALDDAEFDVVDCQNFPYFPCFSTKLHTVTGGAELIITWHEQWGRYWFEYLGRKGVLGLAVEKLATKLTHRHVAVSQMTRDDLVACGLPGSDVTVIPNGITISDFADPEPVDSEFDVVFVGRLIQERNIDVLLRAVTRLPDDVHIAIVGDGPEYDPSVRLASDLGIDGQVSFFGFVDEFEDVISIMKSSKVFVHPSTREGGSSIVTLEANACRLPVIAVRSDRGISPELIRDGDTGLFIDELSEVRLAESIRRLLSNHSERREMSRRAFEFAEGFDWDVVVDRAEQYYRDTARLPARAGR